MILGVRAAESSIPHAGRGIFAETKFYPGDLIMPYDGDVLTKAEVDRRYPGDEIAVYTLRYNGNPPMYIDAACARNAGSIVNNAGQPGDVNVEFLTVGQWARRVRATAEEKRMALSVHRSAAEMVHNPKWRLWVVAKKKITRGEELLADYGHDYDMDRIPKYKTKYVSPKRFTGLR